MTKEQSLWVHSRNVLCHLRFIRATYPETIKKSYDDGADYVRELIYWLKANVAYAPEVFQKNPEKI